MESTPSFELLQRVAWLVLVCLAALGAALALSLGLLVSPWFFLFLLALLLLPLGLFALAMKLAARPRAVPEE